MKRNKKVLSSLLTLAMVMGLSVPVMAGDMDGKVVILHTNDMHGAYVTTEKSMGMAGIKGIKDHYESLGAEVLLFDAGDYSQGNTLVNYYKGRNAAEYMVAAGYDAVTLGNHEFDFGFEELKKNTAVFETAEIPVLVANVLKKDTTETYFDGSAIFEQDGLKVGVFGLDTAETQTKSSPSSVSEVTFLDGEEMFAASQVEVDKLEEAGCEFIVALTHLGVDDESVGRQSIDLAENVEGIDLIIDGHSHTEMPDGELVGETLVVSTGSALNNVGVVTIDTATMKGEVELITAVDYATNIGKYDETITAMVAEDKAEVDTLYAGIFATTEVDLNGEREPGVRTEETNLGNFSADAMLYASQEYVKEQNLDFSVDVALSNGGGIRASIPKGEISMNTLYTVFPYGNNICLVTVTGAQLLEIIEASTFASPTALGGFPQVAGMEFTVNTAVEYVNGEQYPDSTYYAPANPGSRVTITSIGGEAFDLEKEYTVSVSTFQASGGDTYYELLEGSSILDTGILDAEALVQYVESMDGVIGEKYATTEGRVTFIDKPEIIEEEIIEEIIEEEIAEEEIIEEEIIEPEIDESNVPELEEVERIYKVIAGDNLWKIAKNLLGDGNEWISIYELNKEEVKNPEIIYIGQELLIYK